MTEKFKVVAITYLGLREIQAKLSLSFSRFEDVLGPLQLATGKVGSATNFQIRIRETSPQPATEIMLPVATARTDLDVLLQALGISREELFWIHPRAGGALRRHVVDVLFANLEEPDPLIQILVGPRQVGKTTSVRHLIKEWSGETHYASADGVVDEYGPWLQRNWQEALLKGEGTLLVLDEIQKVDNWTEHVKALWDKTKSRGIRVVLLGSTSLSHLLSSSGRESLAGRFESIYVPHWSFPETAEAFGTTVEDFALFGGYPKAMELASDAARWSEYMGKSVINPIIDVDIFQQGNFRQLDGLRRSFRVFCEGVDEEINYSSFLREIQSGGNIDIVKRYLTGYTDSFLFSQVHQIDDNGHADPKAKSRLMVNCPAVYSFGRSSFDDISVDRTRFQQSVASELMKIPNKIFGYWQKNEEVGMDYYIKTPDNQTFGVYIEKPKSTRSATKSFEGFRKTFDGARIVSVNEGNFRQFLVGQRAFLETAAI